MENKRGEKSGKLKENETYTIESGLLIKRNEKEGMK
jgi:hypothetical protein